MANEEASFEDLLKDAPVAAKATTVSLTGALARAEEPGKFGLTLADGRSLTLDTKAVKSHTRLGGAAGQVLVQLELDAKLVPDDMAAPEQARNTFAWFDPKQPFLDTAHVTDLITIAELTGHHDPIVKPALSDGTGAWDPLGTGPSDTFGGATLAEQIGPVGPGPVFSGGQLAGGAAPFALATQHQAPAETIAALGQFGGGLGFTPFWWDRFHTFFGADHKPPWIDGKPPPADGTIPSRFPGVPPSSDY
ncbi:MAG: hypothetical protein WBQ75_09830 [Acetobacteraceae bacterium]